MGNEELFRQALELACIRLAEDDAGGYDEDEAYALYNIFLEQARTLLNGDNSFL